MKSSSHMHRLAKARLNLFDTSDAVMEIDAELAEGEMIPIAGLSSRCNLRKLFDGEDAKKICAPIANEQMVVSKKRPSPRGGQRKDN